MEYIRWVLEALINACRADLKHALAGHWKSAKALRKSMKTQLSKDFVIWTLKTLKKKPPKSYPQSVQFAILWDGASSHSDRKTLLTNLVYKGTAIHILKTLACHRSISTTAACLHSSPSLLKDAVELVWDWITIVNLYKIPRIQLHGFCTLDIF
jgi:hypothetical protein